MLLTLVAYKVNAQESNCEKFKNGHFIIPKDSHAPESTIIRNGSIQTEQVKGSKEVSEFVVEWVDECTYTLTPTAKTRKLYKNLPKDATLTVEIIEVKKNSYIQRSTSSFSDFVATTEVIKVK